MSACDRVGSSRALLDMIQAQGLAGTWSWSFADDRHDWSAGLYTLLGLVPGAVPAGYAMLRSLIHPEDRDAMAPAAELVQAGVVADRGFRVIRPDGTLRTVASRTRIAVAPDGRPLGASGIVFDVSDRERLRRLRDAEALRRDALAAQARIFVYAEAEVPFVVYGPAFLDLLGLTPEAVAENWAAVAAPEEWPRLRAQVPPLYAAGRPYGIRFLVRLADGTRQRFRFSAAPVRDAAGRITEWTLVITPADPGWAGAPEALRQSLEQSVEGRHLRAARALLDWTLADLAMASGLSIPTVRRFEEDAAGPAARSRHAVIAALRAAGIRFSLQDGKGLAVARG